MACTFEISNMEGDFLKFKCFFSLRYIAEDSARVFIL